MTGRIDIQQIPTKIIPVATDGILIHNQSFGTRLLTVETLAGIASDAVNAPVIVSVVINGVPYEGAILSATVTLSAGSEGAYYAYDWYIDDVLAAQTELFTIPTGTLGKEVKVVATVVNSLGTDDDEDIAYVFRRLITEDGYIDPQFTVTRAGVAHAFNANGELVEYPANTMVPRYDPVTGAFLGPLVCEQRTNYFPNARCIGEGTSRPPNFALEAGVGLSSELLEQGTIDGIPYAKMRIFGTPNATSTYSFRTDTTTITGAGVGSVVSFGTCLQFVGGSLTNVGAVVVRLVEVGGSFPASTFTPNFTADKLAKSYISGSRTKTESTSDHQIRYNFGVTSGQAVDFTIMIALPQLKLAPVACDPILPPVGTIAASTRNASNPFMLNQDFGMSEGTILTDMRGDVTKIGDSGTFGRSVTFQNAASSTSNNSIVYSFRGVGHAEHGKFRIVAVNNSGSSGFIISTADVSATVFKKSALKYKSGNNALSAVGVATATNSSTILPQSTLNRLDLGRRKDNTSIFPYPEIRALYHMPVGATNAYLEGYVGS